MKKRLILGDQAARSKRYAKTRIIIASSLAAVIGLLVLMGLFGVNPGGYSLEQKFEDRGGGILQWAPPSLDHILGTDARGYDVFSHMVSGLKTTMILALISVIFYAVFGIVMGVYVGYSSSSKRRIIQYIVDLLNNFPILLLLLLGSIAINSLMSKIPGDWRVIKIYFVMALFGIFSSPRLAELIKNAINNLKSMDFIKAAEALGLSDAQIITKHILWYECKSLIMVQMAVILSQAVLVEVTLTYLRFGVYEPNISLGTILSNYVSAMTVFRYDPHWMVLVPLLVITCLAFYFFYLAELLNDTLKPKIRYE